MPNIFSEIVTVSFVVAHNYHSNNCYYQVRTRDKQYRNCTPMKSKTYYECAYNIAIDIA